MNLVMEKEFENGRKPEEYTVGNCLIIDYSFFIEF